MKVQAGEYSWRVFKKKKKGKRGGWKTEAVPDWLQLHAPSHLTTSLSAGQSGASVLFERCQREKEGEEEEERSFKGEKEEKKKKQRGVRDDECAAGLQPLQFAGAERRFLSWLVLTCSAAGSTAPRGFGAQLHHMVHASLVTSLFQINQGFIFFSVDHDGGAAVASCTMTPRKEIISFPMCF